MAAFGQCAHSIASTTASPTAQRTAADLSTTLRDALLSNNSHVDTDLWCELYQTKGPRKLTPQVAKAAVGSALNRTKLEHVLSVETRGTVLGVIFAEQPPSTEMLLANPLRKLLAEARFAKMIGKKYGPVLDLDLLATVPADEFADSLRVWRLLAPSLTDAEVLAEIRSYDTWASPYVQANVGWVLHQRPHLVEDLVDCDSVPVKTQLSGSPHLGRLTRSQQQQVLDLDNPWSTTATGWLNERAYLWMAAAANPTVDHTLVPDIGKRLDAQTETFTDGAHKRTKFNDWSVTSLADPELTDAQLDRIIRWATGGDKTRLGAVDVLLDNPALDDASAYRVATGLVEDLGRALWRTDQGREVLVKFAARFPTVEADAGLLQSWDDYRAATLRVSGDEPATPATPSATLEPPDVGHLKVGADLYASEVAWLDARVGENPALWRTVFETVDTLSQVTLEQLVTTCQAMAA